MLAALFDNIKNVRVIEQKIPKPETGSLLIQVRACGVCGTDFHIFEGKAPASFPVIPGHEYTGIVVDKSPEIKKFNVGDKIAVNPNIHCGYCQYCQKGKINLCENLKALGVTMNGGFSDYSVVPVSQAYFIPSEVQDEVAAFSEPLSCCIHGIDQADIQLGNSVAIIGAGPIGLLMLQLARLKGAGVITVIDPIAEKRRLAAKLNSSYTLDPFDPVFGEKINDISKDGFDIVIECAGNPASAETALNSAKKGGRIVIFGLASSEHFIKVYLQSFFHRELTIKSSLLNPFTFASAVDLLISGKIRVDILNTKPVPLIQDLVSDLFIKERDPYVLKYIIKPNLRDSLNS